MTVRRFSLDPDSRSPLYRQLEDQILYAISVSELKPGDPLPSIRQLEQQLGVNRNTVRRAYQELQAKGAIVLRRGQAAEVAETPPAGEAPDTSSPERAVDLGIENLRRCESWGVDGLQFAHYLTAIARQHDASYPKLAFAECNSGMAEAIARRIADRMGRSVEALVVRHGTTAPDLPASVRFVFTPPWHLAETTGILADRNTQVLPLSLRLDEETVTALERAAGRRVLIVVRDSESTSGYRALIHEHAPTAHVDATLSEVVEKDPAVFDSYDVVVHTTPCLDVVRSRASDSCATVELVFVPSTDELDDIADRLFPDLATRAQIGLQAV